MACYHFSQNVWIQEIKGSEKCRCSSNLHSTHFTFYNYFFPELTATSPLKAHCGRRFCRRYKICEYAFSSGDTSRSNLYPKFISLFAENGRRFVVIEMLSFQITRRQHYIKNYYLPKLKKYSIIPITRIQRMVGPLLFPNLKLGISTGSVLMWRLD